MVSAGLIAAGTLATGCWERALPPPVPPTPSPFPELGISTHNFPRMDGSTSTLPLARLIACRILDARYQWTHDESDDSRHLAASDELDYLDEPYRGEKRPLCEYINRTINHHGTHEAYDNLIRNQADLILVARKPSADELQQASAANVELDVEPVALDAFVFLLNGENPIANLSLAQIRDIYSGKVTNWRQVGGPDAGIRPYQRTRNSGSQELMRSLVMKDRQMIKAPDLLTGALMSSPFLAIAEDRFGIGYSVYYYHEFMSPRATTTNVKSCAVEGIEPTSENIRSRAYPLVTDVFVVIRRDMPIEHHGKRMRDWLLEPVGQQIVEESGYVPLLPILEKAPREVE
jgi:phosphate transport system substrate-binding protein